jgi:hypothetical protein
MFGLWALANRRVRIRVIRKSPTSVPEYFVATPWVR